MHPRGISLFRAPGVSRWIVTTLAVAAVILSAMTATVAATAADGADVPTTSEQPQDAATPEETEQPIDSPEETEPPAEPEEPDAPADSSDEEEPSGEVLEPVTPADPVDPQAILAGFSAGNIISDAVFTDKGTMTEAQIQAFFNSKVKTCRGGSDSYGPIVCLKDYRTDSVNRPADTYCKGYTGAKGETAARIIYRVAQSCNINPRVLIVMLQKEQSLVTHTWPSAWRYDKALGQGCPDDASCNPAYVGFFHQIYGAARQMQIYLEGRYFTWYAPGKTWNIRYDVEVSCGSSPVYVSNKATSAMYYYTPYQPNAASLKAGYGSGDSCSSYGNRNFYNYFTDWFGSTHTADVCAVPGTVTSASRQYVTTTGLNARMAPSTSCDKDLTTLETGTILQGRRVTADGAWIEVTTPRGARWVSREFLRYADSAESACVVAAGTTARSGEYAVRSATTGRIAPWTGCGLRSVSLGKNTVLPALQVSATGSWVQLSTPSGPRWVLSSAVAPATSADVATACAAPEGTSALSDRFVVNADASLLVSPLATCGVGSRDVGAGTVVQGERLSYSGKWVQVTTSVGSRWLSRDAVTPCTDPAGTKRLDKQYVVALSTSAYVSPVGACGPGAAYWGTGTAPLKLSVGTLLEATRISYTGSWIEVRTASGLRWVKTSALDLASSNDVADACADPAGVTALTDRFVVESTTAMKVSPLASCTTGARDVGKGTVVQAQRLSYSGKWVQITTSSGPRWVARDAIAACANPAGTKSTTAMFTVSKSTSAYVSPIGACGPSAAYWGTGTAPLKLTAGETLQATRISYTGSWVEVRTSSGTRWIRAADLTQR